MNNNDYDSDNRYDSKYDVNETYYNTPDSGGYAARAGDMGQFIARVFTWMFLGLIATAAVAALFVKGIVTSPAIAQLATSSPFMITLIIAEIVAVVGITRGMYGVGSTVATVLFFLYAAINGVMLSYIVLLYTGTSIAKAFITTAVFFGVMALYGLVTKSDMSRTGHILLAGLIALLIATLINYFTHSPMMDYVLNLVGLGLFAGLTAYDVNKLKNFYYVQSSGVSGAVAHNIAIYGALMLYLDFINIFIRLIRLTGKRR